MSEPRLLLDTHVWLWLVNGETQIKPALRKQISNSAIKNMILIPSICVWEIGMLWRKQRIQLTKPASEWVREALEKTGFNLVPLSAEIALEAANLPGDFRNDPADCMIVATARIEDATLVSRDSRMIDYAKAGHINLIVA